MKKWYDDFINFLDALVDLKFRTIVWLGIFGLIGFGAGKLIGLFIYKFADIGIGIFYTSIVLFIIAFIRFSYIKVYNWWKFRKEDKL